MAQIIREDIDQLNTKVSIIVEPNDYKQKYLAELQKYQEKGQMKGFRKGKTPASVLERIYGKSILAEVVQEIMIDQLTEAVDGIDYLGDPVMSEDQPKLDFTTRDMQSYAFHFDLGLKPTIKVKGISPEDSYVKYEPLIDFEKEVDELLPKISKSHATTEDIDTEIEDNDFLTLNIKELEDGVEKQDGITSTMVVGIRKEDFFDSFTEAIQGKKVNDTFRFNIFEVEKNFSEKDIRRYYLGELGDNEPFNSEFEATIEQVRRRVPKELTPTFWQEYFGKEDLVSTDEAREILITSQVAHYDEMSNEILRSDIKNYLIANNEIPLPIPFLRRWIKQSKNTQDEELVTDILNNSVEQLTWQIILNELMRTFDIELEENELLMFIYDYYRSSVPYFNQALFQEWMTKVMKNKALVDNFSQSLLTRKCTARIAQEVTLEKVTLSQEDFNRRFEDLYANPKNELLEETNEDNDSLLDNKLDDEEGIYNIVDDIEPLLKNPSLETTE